MGFTFYDSVLPGAWSLDSGRSLHGARGQSNAWHAASLFQFSKFSLRSEGHPHCPQPGFLSTLSQLVQHVSGKKVASDSSQWPKTTGASWEGLWNPWEPSGLGLAGLNLAQQDYSWLLG